MYSLLLDSDAFCPEIVPSVIELFELSLQIISLIEGEIFSVFLLLLDNLFAASVQSQKGRTFLVDLGAKLLEREKSTI